MQALCGYDFSTYKDKKDTEKLLKIPIVNNMAMVFMLMAKENDYNQEYF